MKTHLITALALLIAASNALAQSYRQAPELDKLVQAGSLPPLAQRLPAQPEVITPLTRPGQYGGSLRTALRGVSLLYTAPGRSL